MKKGDKVVCVEGDWIETNTGIEEKTPLKKGNIYTIRDVVERSGKMYLALEEVNATGFSAIFSKDGFRPLINDHKKSFISTSASRELANKPLIREIIDVPVKKPYHA